MEDVVASIESKMIARHPHVFGDHEAADADAAERAWEQRKAAERARHKEAGRVAVTHYVYPEDREKVARYIKRLNGRAERRRAA